MISESTKMDEVSKLEHLSLVSKICTELENHLGLNDKDLGIEYNFIYINKNTDFVTLMQTYSMFS